MGLQARLSLQYSGASSRDEGEESPDSTEQCTGEEPDNAKALIDSATENDLNLPLVHFVEKGRMEG